MITICMACYNRKSQFLITMDSISKSKYADQVYIVVVDDASDDRNVITKDDIPFSNTLITFTKDKKWWVNPGYANNKALQSIPDETDVIILQNPENMHIGDIVESAMSVRDYEYHVYPCYNLSPHSKLDCIPKDYRITISSDEGWRCHPKFDSNILNWCVAFTPNTLRLIGYFDERFFKGQCFDDTEWTHRIYNLDINIIKYYEPYVKHQYHPLAHPSNYMEMVEKNRKIYFDIVGSMP